MEKEMLQQFYLRYSREIYLYLYSMCRSREIAEDLMQDVFLKALLSWKDGSGNLRAWLYRVARNACLNYMRNTGRETQMEENTLPGRQDGLLEQLLAGEQKKALYDGMLQLPGRQREILDLFYFSEMSIKEIALLMKLTPENVRVLAFRAKKTLKEYMEVKGYDI